MGNAFLIDIQDSRYSRKTQSIAVHDWVEYNFTILNCAADSLNGNYKFELWLDEIA